MFINKVVNDVLGFSCLPVAALGLICMAIMRFHMLKKIEQNIGEGLKIPKDFARLPLYLGVGRVVVVYFIAHLLNKLGVHWYTNRVKKWNHLLLIDYPMKNFSRFDKFVLIFMYVSGVYSLTVAGLIYFKIIT